MRKNLFTREMLQLLGVPSLYKIRSKPEKSQRTLCIFWRRKWQPTFAWKVPWTEEPGGLQSMGLQIVRLHWARMHALCVLISAGLVTGNLKAATPGHTVLVKAYALYSVFDFLPCGRASRQRESPHTAWPPVKVISGPNRVCLILG